MYEGRMAEEKVAFESHVLKINYSGVVYLFFSNKINKPENLI